MASVDVIFVAIIILGIIYMYINSRQYLVREGFSTYSKKDWKKQGCVTTHNRKYCNPNCVFTDYKNRKTCNTESGMDCVQHWMECKK